MVFCFHRVEFCAADLGRHHRLHADQRSEQVDAVDGLGQQHAAAIARQRTAAGLVVIGLRAPPGYPHRCGLHAAQLPAGQRLLQRHRPGLEAELQHHAELPLAVAGQIDEGLGALQRDLERLLQQHMFAVGETLARDLQMRSRRRGDQDGLDGGVCQRCLQISTGVEQALERPEVCRPGPARDGVAQFDKLLQVMQAAQVRLRARADAHEGDTKSGSHGGQFTPAGNSGRAGWRAL